MTPLERHIAKEDIGKMALTAFYPGTFDPITNGHLDILQRAVGIADRLIVAIGVNPGKSPLFSGADRLAMITELTDQLATQSGKDVSALMFDGLAVDAAKTEGATMLIRGLRDSSDFDYEMQMAGMNQSFAPDVVTVFLPSSPSVRHITATLVRQVAIAGRDVSLFVPEFVAQRIAQRLAT